MQNFITLAAFFPVEKKGTKKERERERKIMPLRVATTFMTAAQGQRTHSARTNLLYLYDKGSHQQVRLSTTHTNFYDTSRQVTQLIFGNPF